MPPTRTPVPTAPPPRSGRRGARLALVIGAVVVLVVGVTVAAVALGVSTARSLQQDTVSRTFAGVREIVVEVDSGTVGLRPAEGPDVVAATVRHFSPGDEPVLTTAVADGVLTLRSDCPSFHLGCETEQQVAVPAGTAVSVRTVDGAIDATGLRTPRFAATTVDGPIRAGFAVVPDDVQARTVSGDVHLAVPPAGYRVSTRSVSGDVGVRVVDDPAAPRTLTATTVSGAIELASA